MRLRWTEEAAADLEHITGYLFEKCARACSRVGAWNLQRPVRAADLSLPWASGQERGNTRIRASPDLLSPPGVL